MSPQLIDLLITSLLDTLLMVGVASAIAVIIGIPLGVTLTVTARGNMLENQPVNHVLGAIINATRSVPFVILMNDKRLPVWQGFFDKALMDYRDLMKAQGYGGGSMQMLVA